MTTEKTTSQEQEAPPAPEKTSEQKEDILRDFRSTVEHGATTEGQPDVKPEEQRKLNIANRKNIRCASCGHFLFEVVAARAYIKSICRQGECKALNEVTIDGMRITIDITPKEARERQTYRY
jgi:phage FluMu protein Com